MFSSVLDIPGFVDLQVNGFSGVDFSSDRLTEESFLFACRRLVASGTAAFLPTLITHSEERLSRNLACMSMALSADPDIAQHVLGFHLEGPFISGEPGAVGCHPPEAVRPPDIALFDRLQNQAGGRVRLLTVAAEQPGAAELARHVAGQGVVVAGGHQLAGSEQLARLAEAGATALTHLGNGMPNQVHRHNNPLLAGLAEERLSVLFIADGHHLPPHVLKVIIRAAGVERLIATTDCTCAAGLPPGTYEVLGTTAVLEPDGLLHNLETQGLVGSSATMVGCLNVLFRLGLLSAAELVRVGFCNPLALLRVPPESVPSGPHRIRFTLKEGFACILDDTMEGAKHA